MEAKWRFLPTAYSFRKAATDIRDPALRSDYHESVPGRMPVAFVSATVSGGQGGVNSRFA
jgi:hypothetical protein